MMDGCDADEVPERVWRIVKERFRIVFGFQSHSSMNAIGLADRVQQLREIPPERGRSKWLAGAFAAAADHLFRCQREADSEADKQTIDA